MQQNVVPNLFFPVVQNLKTCAEDGCDLGTHVQGARHARMRCVRCMSNRLNSSRSNLYAVFWKFLYDCQRLGLLQSQKRHADVLKAAAAKEGLPITIMVQPTLAADGKPK